MAAFTIRTKLILIFSIVIIVIVILSLVSVTVSQKYLRDSVGESSTQAAERILVNMSRALQTRIDGIEMFVASDLVRRKVAESTVVFETSAVEKQAGVSLLDSELSKAVQDLLIDFYTRKYGYQVYAEVLVTNRFGVSLAQSIESSEFNHSDEEWWKSAKDGGRYIGPVEFHETSGKTGLLLAIRIVDEKDGFIGVLKACLTLEDIAQNAIFTGRRTSATQAKLVTEQGALIYSTRAFRLFEDVSNKPYFMMLEGKGGYFIAQEGGKEILYSYTRADDENLPWILLIGNDVNEILKPSISLKKTIYLSTCILIILCVLLISLFIKRFTGAISRLTNGAGIVRGGDISHRIDVKSRDETGTLARAFNEMLDELAEQAGLLKAKSDELESRNWIQTGRTELNIFLRGEQNVEVLSRNIVTFLAEYCKAQVGALFLAEEDRLVIRGRYAFQKPPNAPERFTFGEGLVGQAAVDKKINLITNVPDDYIMVGSALGAASPKNILVLPFLFAGQVKGVIELASLNAFSEIQKKFLTAGAESIGIAIHTAQARDDFTNLLRETQAQAEELQTQQEELRVTNEELEGQAQRLQASEEHLKVQQEELQVTNEELEEKNELLERQTREVEQARKKIEEKAEELALSGKYKSAFLANMSHELRTPLNSLLLLSQSLADNKGGNLSEEQVKSAEIIYNGGNDLLNLINEILDLSKIEAGRMDLEPGIVKIDELAEEVRIAFGFLAKEKSLSLEVNVSADAPEEIVTDGRRVGQVLKNLVSNAIKFTETGGITLEFGSFSRNSEGEKMLSIAVTDTGIGMTPEQQKIVFETFQQADGSTSRMYGGTGLGLSISRELARLLGGEIHLKSEVGRGSVFTLYLPLALPPGHGLPDMERTIMGKKVSAGNISAAAVPPGTPQHIEDDRESIEESDMGILIIEDDKDFAAVLRAQCHERGLKCLTALTGEAGLDLAKKYLPQGVLLDINLPGIDGWSVLSELKDDPRTRHIPVHIISADEVSDEAQRRGAAGYAAKPLTAGELEKTFNSIDQAWPKTDRRVLVVEDDDQIRADVVRLVSGSGIKVDEASTGEQVVTALKSHEYECVILDLGLPDVDGTRLLKKMKAENVELPPVIVYTARELSREQEADLLEYTESVVIKDVRSPERLLDEVSLFLHQTVSRMDENKKQISRNLHEPDELLKDKTVFIVDDDMRTAFAVSRLLTELGMKTLKAENGEKALQLLEQDGNVDLILMDIMMPVMDGYETIKRIRAQESFEKLPIIALTANAMKEDRQRCIEAGANDYLSKPVDQARLISILRVWLYRQAGK